MLQAVLMKFLRILFALLKKCGQKIRMHPNRIKFCEGCDNFRRKYCAGKNILPNITFVDYEKLRIEYKKSESSSCDIIYDDGKSLIYIENKHIYYFVQFIDMPNKIEDGLCNVIKKKLEDSVSLYERLFPISHSNRYFVLFFSEKVPFPQNHCTSPKNKRIAEIVPTFLKYMLLTSISAVHGFLGMKYIHSSGKVIEVNIDECANASLYIH